MAKRVVLPHFCERVDESPRQDENFGTFGLFLSFFVSELRPFNVKDKFFQCIFEALFINSASALLLTAVEVVVVVVVFYYCDMGEDWYNCYTLKNKHSVDSPGHSWPLGHNCMLICNCEL